MQSFSGGKDFLGPEAQTLRYQSSEARAEGTKRNSWEGIQEPVALPLHINRIAPLHESHETTMLHATIAALWRMARDF